MPTTGVAQWTCAVSNLVFIYIYGLYTERITQENSYSSSHNAALWLHGDYMVTTTVTM